MLEDFSAGRGRVTAIAEEAARCARGLGEDAVARRLADEGRKLAAEEFNLAVMGEFKRGKSTLINALIGANVLPTAVVPLTSVVTVVRHGITRKARVEFLDGQVRGVGFDELDAYTTERGNPSNTKGVRRVEIEYPAPLLEAGVRLIDTPGVGSVYEANTAVTLDFLPEADAVLLVLSADQPASQAELDFLHRIRTHVDKLFIILNKTDLLAPADLEEAVAFCRRQLERACEDHRLRLHPLSARAELDARVGANGQALEASGLGPLEVDLTQFLDAQRGTVLLAAARRRIGACLDELASRVELRRQAALMPLATLDGRISDFEAQSERIVWSQAVIGGLLADARRRLVEALEATHAGFVAARAPVIIRALDEAAGARTGGRRKLVRGLQRILDDAVQHALGDWVEQQAARVRTDVAALLERLRDQANAVIADVRALVRELFGTEVAPSLDLAPFAVDPPLARVDQAFSLMLEEVPLLLPGPLARRLIRRRFVGAAPEELRRNLSAATAEFRQRFSDAERVFSHEFRARVEAMLASLREVLARARDDRMREEAGATRIAAELAEHGAALSALRARLGDASRQAA
jgi:GTP-binding protein EngB required for normal cell division